LFQRTNIEISVVCIRHALIYGSAVIGAALVYMMICSKK